ncbi:FKBP12-associated protein [Sorochytrium milnesiophthora]
MGTLKLVVSPKERNRRLAAAFNLRPERAETLPDTSASHLPDYNIWILDYAYANHPFAKMVETTLGDFVQRQQQKQQDQDTGSTGLRLRPVVSDSVYFPPMKAAARRFVHEYVTFWDLEAQSMDVEPNRSVMVSRSAGKEPKVPAVLVTVAASLHAKHNVPIVNVSTPVGTASSDQESDTNAAPKPRKATAAVNALLLVGVSPELTMLDIESYVRSYFSPVKFETRWHEESGCLLLPDTRTVAIYDMEPFLKRIRGSLKPVLVNAGKVNDIRLAWVTSDGTVCGPGGKRPDATAGGKTGGVEQPEKTVRKPANAFAQLEQLGELSLSDV